MHWSLQDCQFDVLTRKVVVLNIKSVCWIEIKLEFSTKNEKDRMSHLLYVFIISILILRIVWVDVWRIKSCARAYLDRYISNFHWFHKSIKEKQFFLVRFLINIFSILHMTRFYLSCQMSFSNCVYLLIKIKCRTK